VSLGYLSAGCRYTAQSLSAAVSLALPRLPETGDYTILIVPNASAVLHATVTLSTDFTGAVVADAGATVFNTTRVGQNARYTFAGTAGQNLSLVLSEDTFPGTTDVFVYQPDGSQWRTAALAYSSGPGSSATVPLPNLPTSGTFTVAIAPHGTATGSISMRLSTP